MLDSADVQDRRRKVQRLSIVQRWAPHEIAKALGVPEGTVKDDLEVLDQGARDWCDRNIGLARIAYQAGVSFDERQKRRWEEYAAIKVGTRTLPDGTVVTITEEDASRLRMFILGQIQADQQEYAVFLCKLTGAG